jgi:hypothetical protein
MCTDINIGNIVSNPKNGAGLITIRGTTITDANHVTCNEINHFVSPFSQLIINTTLVLGNCQPLFLTVIQFILKDSYQCQSDTKRTTDNLPERPKGGATEKINNSERKKHNC